MGNPARKRRRGIRENAPKDTDNIPDEGGKEASGEEDEALASSSQELNESPISPRLEHVASAAPTGEYSIITTLLIIFFWFFWLNIVLLMIWYYSAFLELDAAYGFHELYASLFRYLRRFTS